MPDNSTIVSIIPWDLFEVKPTLFPGRFEIKASPDAKTPIFTTIGPSTYQDYKGDDKWITVPVPSETVAASIVRDYVNSQVGLSTTARPGIAYLPGAVNVLDANFLKELVETQNNWFRELVRIADDYWTRYHLHVMINDTQRLAANSLNLKSENHPWMSKVELGNISCPVCKVVIPESSIVCASCKVILKPEAALNFKFAK